ncbi:Uma2 family endonuclease [Nostoc sp. FACHB-87]|uniref:Uma2 family endonuclease n=2 Tax=Cyanophyceae TaxID=3028117 RepID=UPI001684774D|nr:MULTISPECIES: Uma2 family endonuclease [Nostocales]MBD2299113.1 Uma2 family endonuclease [Nostoc sp. FACHB-190]MBD2456801.1 Uma2 family endonuclease [Nostoc sp. FACHB-87]MBD2476430.1 Uma2 family endonuclease [Anabaena sp. FACHB-83]MBD2488373.1 Uma2 family endonuclease [Aulosira sp. FACHB-615]
MFQPLVEPVTFEEFLEWKPDNGRYELHKGVIVEMQPTGDHELVRAFLIRELNFEIRSQNLAYTIPSQALVKAVDKKSGYIPDVLVLNLPNLVNEPLWQKSSTVSQAESIPLIVEVVSTNWRDDYFLKFAEYEEIGIAEYWIVDYAALGGKRFIGSPKQPTISVYTLIEGEYQITQFRGSDRIQSLSFPELSLTAEQIFQVVL